MELLDVVTTSLGSDDLFDLDDLLKGEEQEEIVNIENVTEKHQQVSPELNVHGHDGEKPCRCSTG